MLSAEDATQFAHEWFALLDRLAPLDEYLKYLPDGDFEQWSYPEAEIKDLEHLLLGGPMNPRVSNRPLPVQQVLPLFFETGERVPLQAVALDILHSRFDLPLVPGHPGFRGKDDRAVVLAERLNLGCQHRIEPIGMQHGCFEVVNL